MLPAERGRQIERLIETARRGLQDQDPLVQDWLMAAAVSSRSSTTRHLEQFLNIKAVETELRGTPFYQPQTFSPEGLHPTRVIGLGFAHQSGVPCILNLDHLTEHGSFWGGSGVGKSTFLRLLLPQIAKHAKLIIVDRDKQDYRSLIRLLPDLTVVDVRRDLAWNCLHVQTALTPELTITNFVQDFSMCMGLMIGSQSMLQTALHALFVERGIYDGSVDYPTLRELRGKIAGLKHHPMSRSGSFKDSLLNRIDGMLFESPRAYDYQQGIPIERLADEHVLFEVAGLNAHHARFLIYNIVRTLFLYRLRSGQRGNVLRTCCCVDESSWFAPRIKDSQQGWTPLAELLARVRESGLGFLLAAQSTDVDEALLKNTRTRVLFRLGDGRCIDRAGTSLALTKEQKAHIPFLDTGQCILRVPAAHPFLLNIPDPLGAEL